MSSPLNQYQNLVHDLVAEYGQSVTMDLYRPAYDLSGSETKIASGLAIRLDPATASSQLQHRLSGANYFVVAGPKELIEVGDVLKPNPDDGCTPKVTIIQNTEMGNITAFRSNLIGKVIDTTRIASPVFDNIYYDFAGAAGPTDQIIQEFEGSRRFETGRIIIWNRPSIEQGMRFMVGNRRYYILQTVQAGNHMMLQVRGDEL